MAKQYEYKMVQLPQTFVLKQDTGKEIAAYLEKVTHDMEAQGPGFPIWCFSTNPCAPTTVRNPYFIKLMGYRQRSLSHSVHMQKENSFVLLSFLFAYNVRYACLFHL